MDRINIEEIINASLNDHTETISFINSKEFREKFSLTLDMVYRTIISNGCIFTCGNGGSFSDAQHFTAEFIVRYKRNRKPLSSITLGCNSSVLSACSNDFSYDDIFVREYQALCKENDTLIAISTSGNSKNIRKILEYASNKKRKWVLLTSDKTIDLPSGGNIIKFPFKTTAAVQEAHIFTLQLICRAVDDLIIGPDKDSN